MLANSHNKPKPIQSERGIERDKLVWCVVVVVVSFVQREERRHYIIGVDK